VPAETDVELARACARGDAAAIAEVERRFSADQERALARLRLSPAAIDEVRQIVREKLFVAREGAPPGIASYEGKGSLGGFMRAVTVHAALTLRRAQQRVDFSDFTDSKLAVAAAADDPELAEVRRRYGASFKQAFADALSELSPRERNVLRLVYVDGLGLEQVALVYDVHRVSVSRWLAGARETLQTRSRALLAERLSLDAGELASVARLCLSEIDVSLDRLLRGA